MNPIALYMLGDPWLAYRMWQAYLTWVPPQPETHPAAHPDAHVASASDL